MTPFACAGPSLLGGVALQTEFRTDSTLAGSEVLAAADAMIQAHSSSDDSGDQQLEDDDRI